MIDFESSDELEIGVGDNIEVITNIHLGDTVVFENMGRGNYILKVLNKGEIPA